MISPQKSEELTVIQEAIIERIRDLYDTFPGGLGKPTIPVKVMRTAISATMSDREIKALIAELMHK